MSDNNKGNIPWPDISTIQKKRVKLGLTQKELAGLSGIAQPDISRLEKGQIREPAYNTVRKLIDALGDYESKLPGGTIDEPIVAERLMNLSISNSDLGDGIVTSGKIKDGTIQRQDIASGVMPAGATNVIYGTCHINIISEANGFAFGSCPVPGVVIGDAVVGNVAGLGDAGEFDVKLESLTTQTGDCDPCENGLIHWIVKNDGSEPINITTVLQYIVFNNNINVDG